MSSHSSFPTFPSPWQLVVYFFTLWTCLFWTLYMNEIREYVIFHVWLLSLSIMFSRFIHILPCVSTLFLFYDSMIFHWMNRLCFVAPFISWWTVGLSPLWTITNNTTMNIHVQVFIWTYVFSSLGHIPKSGIAGSYGISVFSFWGTIKWFSKVAASVYIPTSTELQFLCILTNLLLSVFLIIAILVYIK